MRLGRSRTTLDAELVDQEGDGDMTTAAPEVEAASTTDRHPKPADVFVVFGITGDLAKVMTFDSLYRLEQRGLLDCPIVGVAVDDWTVDQLKDRARESIVGTGESIDEKVFDRFADRLSYVSGDFGDDATYERVAQAVDGAKTPVFYLEIPPFLFGRVVKGLSEAGLTKTGRVVVLGWLPGLHYAGPTKTGVVRSRTYADEVRQKQRRIASTTASSRTTSCCAARSRKKASTSRATPTRRSSRTSSTKR